MSTRTQSSGTYARLFYLAYYDELTGLANRSHWQEQLRKKLERGSTQGGSDGKFAVLLLDLDDFKVVNDSLGHQRGDEVLAEVAARLRSVVRPDDVVGRLGGDEFAVLLPEVGDDYEAIDIAQRIIEALSRPLEVGRRDFRLGTSIGIAQYPEHGTSRGSLLFRADRALYSAKRAGGSCYRLYSPLMGRDGGRESDIRDALRRAIEEREFVLYYQPLLNLRDGRMHSAEALVRWNDPQNGLLGPDNFIRTAERAGLMPDLGRWIYDSAIRQIRAWHLANCQITVSLNVSAKQLQDPTFCDYVLETLESNAVPLGQLELEVTESAAFADIDRAGKVLSRLNDLGIRTLLDDFGTHYSSLTYLQQLPIDTIKIDRSFVAGLPHNKDDAAIVRNIITLGHDLQRTIVAEGVETREQLDWLLGNSCDFVQGYLVEKPMPASRFQRWRTAQVPFGLAG